uniref:Plant heme peroxidase family profile domain-containing protein n=1 Tax=Oryza rufipogon TaxID=4529 RepID=A0A0E0PEF7_ORYRU
MALLMGAKPTAPLYSSLLQCCISSCAFRQGKSVHGRVAAASASPPDLHLSTKLVIFYARFGDVAAARKVFDGMPHRSVVSWTAMVSGYARNGRPREALELFALMHASGARPNQFTYGSAASACAGAGCARSGEQVHACAAKGRFAGDMFVQSALMDMHLRCGSVEDARQLFAEMGKKDVVSWNALIRGFVERGHDGDALGLFSSMLKEAMIPDHYTLGSALKACGIVGVAVNVELIHSCIIKLGYWDEKVVIGSLINSYAKCRSMSSARVIYDSISEPDLVSSTALISGYTMDRNYSEDAMELFCKIHRKGLWIDGVLLSSVLCLCASVASARFGTQIHAYMCKKQPMGDIALDNALVDMYAKAGEFSDAKRAFDEMPYRNVISWTSLITACGRNGSGEDAVTLFNRMVEDGVRPNDVTFLSLLSACGHCGLTNKGMEYFTSMMSRYGIDPRAEHYSSAIDLLARGGQLEDAWKLVQKTNLKPNSSMLGAMLGACKLHGNMLLGETAAKNLFSIDPGSSVNYAVLANMYAECSLWEDAQRTREVIDETTDGKEGCDGSILLDSTPGSPSEKESIPNLSLRGFGTIDRVKAKLEQACPGVVSCADILALVARDVVFLTKGPHWEVPTGRRDGTRSVKDDAVNNLPPPFFDATRNLYQFFIPKGLDAKDQVVLLGGHTLGTSHCSSFASRLYNFSGMMMADPTLDKYYVPRLKSKCQPGDKTTLVEMDPGSFRTFDTSYYRHIARGRALFTSDETLMLDPFTRGYILRQAGVAGYPAEFFADFAASMVKMGNMQVLTGAQGEIRKHCAFVN